MRGSFLLVAYLAFLFSHLSTVAYTASLAHLMLLGLDKASDSWVKEMLADQSESVL